MTGGSLAFKHRWTAEILRGRPLILPGRHFVYPAVAEEVERGALEVLVRPRDSAPFLATCALGFRDPAAPTGVWAMPDPDWMCAVSGGYAYLIDTAQPERFTMVRYRPVLSVLPYLADEVQSTADASQSVAGNWQSPAPEVQSAAEDWQSISSDGQTTSDGLLLFAGHHSILAWGRDGEAWESDRLSAEGLTDLRIEGDVLRGLGWDMKTDKDVAFALNLKTGRRI